MLGKIISQLYRIADLLKTKKLVDKDSNTDNNSSEDKPKEITLDDIYQYYKSQLEVKLADYIHDGIIQPFPETFDDIPLTSSSNVDITGIYKCIISVAEDGKILFSYVDNDIRYYICYFESNK